MNPITKYLKNLFAYQRFMGDNTLLTGLVKVDTLLQRLVDENKVPGISISVVKEGEMLFQKGYGYANLESKNLIDPKNTIFRIASVSKNIAATALAQMVNEGLIDLDASFYKYVPYFPKKKWDFTLRQLASHTAGIRGYRGAEYGLNKPYTIKESIEIFATDDLIFEPGTAYLYNSFGWVLISLAMQEISGIPFEEYVQQKVLNPMGMAHTYAEKYQVKGSQEHRGTASDKVSTVRKPTNLTTFYSKNRLGFRIAIPVNNYYKLAAGGYLSTSEDIAKFGMCYLEGQVLKKAIVSTFLTSQIVNGAKTYYGLGWQVSQDKKGRLYYGHIGNGVGGYSNFFVYPEQQMVFSILTNCTNPNVQPELDEVIDALILRVSEDTLA